MAHWQVERANAMQTSEDAYEAFSEEEQRNMWVCPSCGNEYITYPMASECCFQEPEDEQDYDDYKYHATRD